MKYLVSLKWCLFGLVMASGCDSAPVTPLDGGRDGSSDASGDSNQEGGSTCPGQTIRCADECIDAQFDENNCGACGVRCGSNQVCGAGACIALPTCSGPSDCPTGSYCAGTQCVIGCDAADDCSMPNTSCNTATNQCDCAAGSHLCGTSCVLNNSINSCGTSCSPCVPPEGAASTCDGTTCGFACTGDSILCGGLCVNGQSDETNCGTCGNTCDSDQLCQAGACIELPACTMPSQCPNGSYCADNGTCAVGCDQAIDCTGANTSCNVSSHVCECGTGFHGCANQCVSNNAPTSCGSACTPCPAPPGGTATCNNGSCGFTCSGGLTMCGNACINTQTDESNCGICGTACASTQICNNGSCVTPPTCGPGLPACPQGTACSGGQCAPGCDDQGDCTELNTMCNTSNNTCVCASTYHECGETCVPNSDVNSCGTSCTPCPIPANGFPTCNGSACGTSCFSGYHLCGGVCASNFNPNTCGNSCTACPPDPNGVAACNGTSCAIQCNVDYEFCGGACAACPTGQEVTGIGCSGNTCVATSCEPGYMICSTGCCPLWETEGTLLPSLAEDCTGASVAMSGDELRVATGAPGTNAVYVYVRSGSSWTQEARLTPPDVALEFGNNVALNADGSRLVVGAPSQYMNDPIGTAYVYFRNGSNWTLENKLNVPGATRAMLFGWQVAINGDGTVVALGGPRIDGSEGGTFGQVAIFNRSGGTVGTAGTWSHTVTLTSGSSDSSDAFGYDVDLSAEGQRLIVAAPLDGTGQAYVYRRNNSWELEATLPSAPIGMFFASAVGFDATAEHALVNYSDASSSNQSIVSYDRSGTVWTQSATQAVTAGQVNPFVRPVDAVSLSANGMRGATSVTFRSGPGPGPSGSGVAIYNRSGASWVYDFVLAGAPRNNFFGSGIAAHELGASGARIVVGVASSNPPAFPNCGAYVARRM